jgi:hypothetical protein
MFPRIAEVRYLKDYELEISFSDGTVANLDLHERITRRGGVFEPLHNVEFFARVSVDREAGTLVWPNGVDLCPDVLYAEATGKSIDELDNELDVA